MACRIDPIQMEALLGQIDSQHADCFCFIVLARIIMCHGLSHFYFDGCFRNYHLGPSEAGWEVGRTIPLE